ncbi:MFS transporter [Streptomyces griseocarneus]|uniref:MFS transporter n=1 Tax=Streptomyces griseocarneus TaxID=51201 RepID=UPI0019B22795|nr:MFS transporter [Streptomyces griseocarneus]MBZ6472506.1 MFS transporter [Streptomyces griseocarneus]GHG45592.1 MFS transporter [Streptomyces griseocarneus]
MTTVNSSAAADDAEVPRSEADPRRWLVLALLSGLQFMILLDMTAVNVALPQIQTGLGFSAAGLAWVVNGYVLAAGGLLMLGGRLADVFGRRRLLVTGVVVFAVSSAVSGAAVDPWMMIVGRVGQGTAEALAAPASLGLIALLFSDPKERTKALGIWGGIIGLGSTVGSVVSGLLTDLASWRWIFFINLPVAVLVLVLVPRLVTESRMVREKDQAPDILGGLTLTLGLTGVVYGLLHAADHSWGSTTVVVPLVAGVALLVAMLLIERRARNPLIPLGFFANRTRSVVNVATLFFMAAFISYSFMLTLFEQQVLDYSPLVSGLAWLPLSVAIGAGMGLGTALIPRLGIRTVAAIGYIGAGVGLFITSMIDVDSTYLGGILPGMAVFGLFAGASMPAATNAALHGVTVQDSSLASGVQSTMQQIGSALGVAILVALAIRHAGDAIGSGTRPDVATTDGYGLAIRIGGALIVVGGILLAALLEKVDTKLRDPMAERLADAR